MIFLRHPRPAVAPGTCYGRLDLAEGPRAGAEIARALRRMPPVTAVLSSPARRCRRLARRIARAAGCEVQEDPRLLELEFGEWEGRRWQEISPGDLAAWRADPWTVAPPGGETFAELYARATAMLCTAPAGAAIVTHAGVIRAARMILRGDSLAAAAARPVPNATPLTIARVAVADPAEPTGPGGREEARARPGAKRARRRKRKPSATS